MKVFGALVIFLIAVLDAAAQGSPLAALGAAPALAAPAANAHPAVARIVAPGNGSVSYGSGTLVYTDESHGLVITNWHVINEATQPISVHFPDGFYSLGTVQKADRDWDLALIAIRKPSAEPVPLARTAPQPGELLTIAGYGAGTYRAVSGPCTQYVAPGTRFPFEMVEVAVSARQGDSGGPIFNTRGELAGVLFGEGHGRTSGSYCGRVQWFLASVVPSSRSDGQMVAQTPLRPVAPRPGANQAIGEAYRASAVPIVRSGTHVHGTSAASAPASGVIASTRAADPLVGQTQTIGWEDVAGATLCEQIKTILATIGALAILLHALRWLSAERATA